MSAYSTAAETADLFLAKGFAEQLLARIGIGAEGRVGGEVTKTGWSQIARMFDPAMFVSYASSSETFAIAGAISSELQSAYDLRLPAYLVLFDLDAIFKRASELRAKGKKVQPIPKYPAVERDLALVVPNRVSAAALTEAVAKSVDRSILRDVRIFDEFRSKEMKAAGERSLAIRLVLQSAEKTFDDAEIEGIMTTLTKWLTESLGARLRT